MGKALKKLSAKTAIPSENNAKDWQKLKKQQRQAETLAAERENQAQEMQTLGQQIERTQARIDALQEEHGSNLESESELNRLKQLKNTTLKKRKKN